MLRLLQPIILSLIPVAFIITLGWVAGKREIINKHHSHSLASYVMNFSFPCALLLLTATSQPQELFNGMFFLAFWLGLLGMYLLSYGMYRYIFQLQTHSAAQASFLCSFPDMAFMGIPIFISLFGNHALLSIAMGNISTSLIMIPLVTVLLSGQRSPQINFGQLLLTTFSKPLVWAPILGTAWSVAGWQLPLAIQHSLNLIGSTTSGVSLFALGLMMSSFAIRWNRLVLLTILLKNIVQPLLMLALIWSFNLKEIFAVEAILLCAMPTATMTAMFGLKYNVLAEESTSVAIIGTIFSLITLSGWMLFLKI